MAKIINPIPAQGLIYPYVKIFSWTIIYYYQGFLSMFLFNLSLLLGFVVKGWSIFMCYGVSHFNTVM